jgi:2-polyprenyl-3-methyl-5-hydroxy-6-metoxy-1,4-benzoquinol methylase
MKWSAAMDSGEWNHNIHYHRRILRSVPPGAERCLDIGCGDGMLARKLRHVVPHVTAIDRDLPTIQTAIRRDGKLGVHYLHGDFLVHDLGLESFDFISCVAALHHVDAAAGLARMRDLLKPGGTLVVIGCATTRSPADLPYEFAGIVLHRVQLARQSWAQSTAPTLWPPVETYAGIRKLASTVLPGSSFHRLALWRYSLVWTKPVGRADARSSEPAV